MPQFLINGTVKLEVKTSTASGVNFSVTGAQDNKTGAINAELKSKYNDVKNGVTYTESWTTSNLITSQVEIKDKIKGLKVDVFGSFLPTVGSKSAKVSLEYKQPKLFTRVNVDLLKGPTFHADVVVGQDGFLVGAEIGYDTLGAKVTKSNATLGYVASDHAITLQTINALSIFSVSYYHRVNTDVEAGAKAVWSSKSPQAPVTLEVGTKYFLDKSTFVKAKISNTGKLGVSYTQAIRRGGKVSIAGIFDTTRLTKDTHKLGLSVVFDS
ncbi:Mitochondrial porin [Basidiobolus ranarum]|uniref:Mitochondrial porin n=1 Tax=Basidiobolus ranarum TaxID=34480 RepID=A0ABR2WDL3_9FUNG